MALVDRVTEAADPESAAELLGSLYAQAEVLEQQGPTGLRLAVRGSDAITLARFEFSGHVRLGADLDGVAAFAYRRAGGYRPTIDGEAVSADSPLLFAPGVRAQGEAVHLDQLVVNVDAQDLARRAARRLGVDEARVRFEGVLPLGPDRARHWIRTIEWVWNTLAVDELFTHDLVREAALDFVVEAALADFPIAVEPVPVAAGPRREPTRAVRRAQRFAEEHAHRPVGVAEMAEAAGVSVRSLQRRFRTELDTSPLAHLERVRLEGARDELVVADPSTTSVAAVALRWGFAHAGRFAARYRGAFGESPSETLRRG